MKNICSILSVFTLLGLAITSCNGRKSDEQVVTTRYIHKYGYAVSKQEWEAKKYPGQVITSLNNGVTVTATYEGGTLHGPTTHTYPHSQTIEAYYLYDQGNLAKELYYDIKGMPIRETVRLSPTRQLTTHWYADGAPLSIEEYVNNELLEGQYFTVRNETESRVEKGNGLRIRRNQEGVLLSKDVIEKGYITLQEAFYPNGAPESITHYSQGKLSGEKKMFAQNGEPLLTEEWVNNQLHGKATYYKNGSKFREVSYLNGLKNGAEVLYLDGEQVSQEIHWENDKKHGPLTVYVEGAPHTRWYYDGKEVSSNSFQEQNRLDEMIGNISVDRQRGR